MSQTYKIRVKKTCRETVKVGREWLQKIELLTLLPADRMGGLLAIELEKDGWKRQQDGKVSSSGEQFDLEFDPITQQLRISYQDEQDIEVEYDDELSVYDHSDDYARASETAESTADKVLQKELNSKMKLSELELLKKLDNSENDLLSEIDEMLKSKIEKTHIEALKEKARGLGEVQSIHEDSEAGEVVIRVKV